MSFGFPFLIFSIGFSQLFFPKPSRIVSLVDTITPGMAEGGKISHN
jgi:hypothetical protein